MKSVKPISFLFFCIVSLLLSCNSGSKNKDICNTHITNSIDLTTTEKIHLEIPNDINYNFSQEGFKSINNKLFFWGFDNSNRTLFIKGCRNSTKRIKLNFGQEGVNFLLSAHYSVYFHNWDSIFLVSDYPLRLFLSDSTGQIYYRNKIDKMVNKEQGEFGTYFFKDLKAIVQVKKNLLHLFFIRLYELPQNPQIQYKQPLEAVINFKKNKIVSLFGHYGAPYTNDMSVWYPNLHYSSHCIFNDSLTILSLGASSRVQVYNNRSGRLKKDVCFKSKFVDNIEPIPIDDAQQQDIQNFLITRAYYRNILYDPYRQLFYRIVKHAQELKNSKGELNKIKKAPWSIIFMNKKFQIIGEAKFSGGIFDFSKISLIKKGILIANFSKNKEDEITYQLFSIKKKK